MMHTETGLLGDHGRRVEPPVRVKASASAPTALLGDAQALATLTALMSRLEPRRDAILDAWADSYRRCFGRGRFYARRQFKAAFGAELDTLFVSFRTGTFGAMTRDLAARGSEQAVLGVPFAELVSSIHLFEESCLGQLPAGGTLADHRALDRLSHVRIATLADAYFEVRESEHAARHAALESDLARLARDTIGRGRLGLLVGRSAPMLALYRGIELAAKADLPTLVIGEPGTGKDLAARAIHAASAQADSRYVRMDGAVVTGALLEQLLSSPGTVHLDELTELSSEAQTAVLHAVQDLAARAAERPRLPGVPRRLIVSTQGGLDEAAEAGRLRRDLLHALRRSSLALPPLRERIDDLPLLVAALLERAGLGKVTPTPAALQYLSTWAWPGNVRELESVLVAAAVAAPDGRIRIVDLPRRSSAQPRELEATIPHGSAIPTLRQAEVSLIRAALAATAGNKRRAAQMLGVSRKWLYSRIDEMK